MPKAVPVFDFVFPTPVGVFPAIPVEVGSAIGLPHACGGVSIADKVWEVAEGSSPRLWGCFHVALSYRYVSGVFPTPVGVFPLGSLSLPVIAGLPHACGGVSSGPLRYALSLRSSPRLWGCFLRQASGHDAGVVFPTPVGVFPVTGLVAYMGARLPHACGGVSTLMPEATKRRESSPRLWGCFYISARQAWGDAVFPTPVGVFLLIVVSAEPEPSLPHACGGVSPCAAAVAISTASSPRLWGCFFNLWRAYDRESVFPTPVGVFLASASGRMAACSLPHACGGVSPVRVHHAAANESSPRLWGCFLTRAKGCSSAGVFPTPVGVFPWFPQ